MRREDIRELTRAVPFQPFRVYISTGETFDIYHPDLIVATTGAAHIAYPSPETRPDNPDQVRIVSLYHIQKIEPLPAPAAPPGSNGSG